MYVIVPHVIDVSIAILIFFAMSCLNKGKLQIIQRLYLTASMCLIIWMAAILGIYYTDFGDVNRLMFFDAITCGASALMVVTILLLSIAFSRNSTALPKMCYLLYVLPVITAVIVFTNPYHHLFYREFSIFASKVKFGPLFMLSGVQYYVYSVISIIIMLRYGLKDRHKMVMWQCMLFVGGLLCPLAVNLLATLRIIDLSIAATPLAFVITMVCHGIAIFYLNFLNIKPIALQNILDNITDGYVIISDDSCIINSNEVFNEMFGEQYGIEQNVYLNAVVDKLEERNRDIIYNLLNFFDVCKQSVSVITYEQAMLSEKGKVYYSVELTPVFLRNKLAGVIALFKDVTKLKEDMKRERETISRAMERERLASLGQMIGGISHNLKTPIMSVAGDVASLRNLVTEYRESIGDEEVTPEDHQEISREMDTWLDKIMECCSYMSDIITTVKGLAANLNASADIDFTIEEVFKRVQLLMKSTVLKKNCRLFIENRLPASLMLKGDINNLVQVVNNLVDNASDAMKEKGGDVVMKAWKDDRNIYISVIDSGTGLTEDVKSKLFTAMFTTKGTKGTGLGLYSSAGLIHGKFGGDMWAEDNPCGGAVFNISIPYDS